MTAQATALFPWMITPDLVRKQWEDFIRRAGCLPKVAEIAERTRVGVSPSETVYARNKLRVLNYVSDTDQQYAPPLLLVFALLNRPYILDLKPGKSVVSHFVRRGFDTSLLDWGIPTHADRHLGMDDYIEDYFDDVVDRVRKRSGCDRINLLGYCMGGSMSAIYTALHPDKIRNLILMAAPVDWSNQDHLLAKWTSERVFDVDKVIDVHGNMPAEMLQHSFLLLKPVSTLVEKYLSFYENMESEKFLEDFFAMETWLNDNIPVAGAMFREFVKHCMQQNQLINGKLRVGGRTVNLADITCPVLNLTAQQDHLVPDYQSLPLNDAVSSTDRDSINFPSGHIGLAVGSKAHRELWPRVCDWLGARCDRV